MDTKRALGQQVVFIALAALRPRPPKRPTVISHSRNSGGGPHLGGAMDPEEGGAERWLERWLNGGDLLSADLSIEDFAFTEVAPFPWALAWQGNDEKGSGVSLEVAPLGPGQGNGEKARGGSAEAHDASGRRASVCSVGARRRHGRWPHVSALSDVLFETLPVLQTARIRLGWVLSKAFRQ